MSPQEAVEKLKAEGQRVRRLPGKDGCPVLLVVPGPAPEWFVARLEEPRCGLTARVGLLRALDEAERPDSGRTVGSLELRGPEAWR
jgi:hypothetical protein